MSAVDDDLLETLTPEEREAMGESEYSETDRDVMQRIAGEESDDDDGDDDEGDDDEIEGDEAPGTDAATVGDAPAADDRQPVEGQDGGVAAEDRGPARYEVAGPEDLEAQLSGLKERDAQLRERFKSGEIDIDERDAGLAELAADREKLLIEKAAAETLARINEQNQRNAALDYERRFVERVKADGVDYGAEKNVRLFNTMLSELSEEHADKGRDWLWTEAHKAVLRARGIASSPVQQRDAIAEARAKRKPPVEAAPATLAQVPGSDGPGDVSDEFADIMALEGLEFEQAIARMSPTQREKFLGGR
jgi:hypothetical protein